MTDTAKRLTPAEQYARDLLKEYGAYAEGPERTREMLDAALGKRALTELLYQERRPGR